MALPGEDVWVWVGHLGLSDRIRMVLDLYGDRITDVSLFSWRVGTTGALTMTFNPAEIEEYREKWPHIRWWACFRNMDDPVDSPFTIFEALRDSAAARTTLANAVGTLFTQYPWFYGVDIDMENGGNLRSAESELIFEAVADMAHSRGKRVSAALPPLTSTGSVGGENWVRYAQLGEMLDHVSIMTYDFAWMGSAPGPIAPGFWVRNVYTWATSQITPRKISMGVSLYGYRWTIHDYPTNSLGWRGDSGVYYAWWGWATGHLATDGTFANPAGSGEFPRAGWVLYRDVDSQSLWGFTDVYDWHDAVTWKSGEGSERAIFDGRSYTVRYGLPGSEIQWQIADNSPGSAHALYDLEPRRILENDNHSLYAPPAYGLTVELLQRDPVAATIVDDYATSSIQLNSIYTGSGTWNFWQDGNYRQYRGSGQLVFNHDFGSQELYLMAKFQFAAAGTFRINSRGMTAELSSTGLLRIMQGSIVRASMNVGALPVGQAPGSGMIVLALRVRDGSARAYYSRTETTIPLALEWMGTTPTSGNTGFNPSSEVWMDHTYLGDAWWYMPREAVEVTVGGQTQVFGRIPRTGVQWNSINQFRPTTDVDERATREQGISLDYVFHHWNPAPLVTDTIREARVVPLDHDVWIARLIVCDARFAAIMYFNDPEAVQYWRASASNEFGLAGVAMWSLGQEDVRLWDRMAGGYLEPATKRLNG